MRNPTFKSSFILASFYLAYSGQAKADPEINQLKNIIAVQEAQISQLLSRLPDEVAPITTDGYCATTGNFTGPDFTLRCVKPLEKTIPKGSWLVTLSQDVATSCDGSLSTVIIEPEWADAGIIGAPHCEPGTQQGRSWTSCSMTFVMRNDSPMDQYKILLKNTTAKSGTVSPCGVGLYAFHIVAHPWFKK